MDVQYFPVDTKSQPTYLALKEWVNEKNLEVLLKCASLNSELKKLLKKYKTSRKGPNVFQVEYCFSKHAYNESGRLYVRNGCGLQMFPKWVRSFLSGEYYIDVDQRKSLPTILKGVLEEYEIQNDVLDDILAEKKSYEKKALFKALLDGKKPSDEDLLLIWDDIYNRLVPKLKEAHYFSDLWKHCKASKNKVISAKRDDSFFALCMQTKECRILLAEKKAMEDERFLVDSLQFDGFLVRKQPELEVTESVLTQCAEKTKEIAKTLCPCQPKRLQISRRNLKNFRSPLGRGCRIHRSEEYGTVVFDGKDFWAFQEQWRPVQLVHITKELLKHVNKDVEKMFKLDLSDDDNKHLEDLLDKLKTNKFVNNTVNMLQTIVYDEKFMKKLDADPMLLGAANGYIDIRTGKLHPHSKDVLISKSVGYDFFDDEHPFDKEIKEQWDDAVKKFFPKKDERRFAQTYMGYCLRGDHPEKACMGAMGTYAKKGPPNNILKSTEPRNQSGHNAHIFANEGSRCAAYEELPGEELDTKGFKDETGGNSNLTGRRVNGKFDETVACTRKSILVFNDKCQLKWDTSDRAFLERGKLVIFRSKFCKTQEEYDASEFEYKFMADKDLDDKIKMWYPYVMRWMMKGHVLYLKEGFTKIPAKSKQWLEETNADVDNLQSWVDDHLEKSEVDDDYVTSKQIKDKMTTGMKNRFKNNDHMIKALSPILGKMIADNEMDKKRVKNVWRRWLVSHPMIPR
ncbi:hypothetical protein HK097_002211 [Rhizophlyctis rosea]|uniref:Bacteriophage/plasmid primase P4 C-terminal domain-containing protein n=1 Tax=Rhizophlyctis rosea TaxID=64517 RepID=A0AAD5X3A7_9FUNG|nr:hypothetical protein HK097_002211 [Rhizophlyctis rosea]